MSNLNREDTELLVKEILSSEPVIGFYSAKSGCDGCSKGVITLYDQRPRWWVKWADKHMCLRCFGYKCLEVARNG